jgi:hypothetical protein
VLVLKRAWQGRLRALVLVQELALTMLLLLALLSLLEQVLVTCTSVQEQVSLESAQVLQE